MQLYDATHMYCTSEGGCNVMQLYDATHMYYRMQCHAVIRTTGQVLIHC
jgi:hypothetical protein